MFKWQPLSPKQFNIFSWWNSGSKYSDMDGIIADGSIRSGKTVAMGTSFIMWAMESFEGEQFAICGKTLGALRRNVLSPMQNVLPDMGYEISESRLENKWTIRHGDNVNTFYLFGGKDESSQNLIQGVTLAGVLFDEVALMPESFVNQATARCSVEGSKWWFNCNPWLAVNRRASERKIHLA